MSLRKLIAQAGIVVVGLGWYYSRPADPGPLAADAAQAAPGQRSGTPVATQAPADQAAKAFADHVSSTSTDQAAAAFADPRTTADAAMPATAGAPAGLGVADTVAVNVTQLPCKDGFAELPSVTRLCTLPIPMACCACGAAL